jgi:hypothetical protein
MAQMRSGSGIGYSRSYSLAWSRKWNGEAIDRVLKVSDLRLKYSRDKRSQGDLGLRGPVDRSGLGEAGRWTSA